MSRVARKQEAARRRLIDAAMGVIAERGVEGLRIREVTDAADVGFGSFYSHFASKEDLAEAVVGEYLGGLAQDIMERVGEREDPAEVAVVAHRLFIRIATENRRLAWLVVRLDRGDALMEVASAPQLRPVLERGVEARRFTEMDFDVTVSFIVGGTISVMRGILEGRLEPDADIETARTMLRACGLGDDEAAALAAIDLG
jgi:AcrR family transcriptional regulator